MMGLSKIYLECGISDLSDEIWHSVNGYENHYHISNIGRVKSLWRYQYSYFAGGTFINNDHKICRGGFFKGYRLVSLCENGIEVKKLVHVLVAESFLIKPSGCNTVDHINMIKTQNNVANLRWTTRSQNTIWAQENGVVGNLFTPKFNKEQVLLIFNDPRTIDELAEEYKVHRTTIHLIKAGKNYSRITGKKYERKHNKH